MEPEACIFPPSGLMFSKLRIFLSLFPQSWGYSCVWPHVAFCVHSGDMALSTQAFVANPSHWTIFPVSVFSYGHCPIGITYRESTSTMQSWGSFKCVVWPLLRLHQPHSTENAALRRTMAVDRGNVQHSQSCPCALLLKFRLPRLLRPNLESSPNQGAFGHSEYKWRWSCEILPPCLGRSSSIDP